MSMFKDRCTITNHYVDGDDLDQYQDTIVEGVYWERSSGIKAESGGYGNNSSVLVLIPYTVTAAEQYVTAVEFEALVDKTGHWTLQEGDAIACRGDRAVITNVSDAPYGSTAHWEVGGV